MRHVAHALAGALGGSTLALVLLWGWDELQWRRIEHHRLSRR